MSEPTSEDVARKERVRLIYRREDAIKRVSDVIANVLAQFADGLDRKLVLDGIQRHVKEYAVENEQTEWGAP